MAKRIRSLYYVYERSGSRVKHTLHKGCQIQIRYFRVMSKEGSIYELYTHVYIIVGILDMIDHTYNIHDGESIQLRAQIPYNQLMLSY